MSPSLESTSLVSIVIPCWNAERFVAEAIRSALAQTYSNKEIIVIDDGSTDRSLEIIRSFGGAVRWETGPNRGGSAARNRGVSLARGEILQFLDADDLLAPDKISLQVPLLLKDKKSVVYCDAADLDLESGTMRVRSPHEHDDFRTCCFDRIGTPAPIHWKSVIQQVGGFDQTLPCAQEFDLHLRLACAGFRFRHIPRAMVTYRRRASSVSSDYVRVLKYIGGIVRRAAALLQVDREGHTEKLRALSEVLAQAAAHLLDRGNHVCAREYLVLARELHPSAGMGVFGALRRIGYKTLGMERAHPMFDRLARIRRSVLRPESTLSH